MASWQMVLTTARVTKGFGFSLVDLLPRRIIVRGSLNDKVAKLIASTRLYHDLVRKRDNALMLYDVAAYNRDI